MFLLLARETCSEERGVAAPFGKLASPGARFRFKKREEEGVENRLNIGRRGKAILISCEVHGRVTNRDTGSNPF